MGRPSTLSSTWRCGLPSGVTGTTTAGWSWTPPDTAPGARTRCSARPTVPWPTPSATAARSSWNRCGRSSARSCTRTSASARTSRPTARATSPTAGSSSRRRALPATPTVPVKRGSGPASASDLPEDQIAALARLLQALGGRAGSAHHRPRPGDAARIHVADSLAAIDSPEPRPPLGSRTSAPERASRPGPR